MTPKTFFGIEWRYDSITLTLLMAVIIIVCTHQITSKLDSVNRRTLQTLEHQTVTMEKAITTEAVIVDRMSDLERRELLVEAQAQVNNDRIKALLDEDEALKKHKAKQE